MSKYTPEQQAVIDRTSGDLVVSASAGSGKTSVMIKRFINLVTKGLAGVDEVLCVTFTNLAAEELRSRLFAGLKELLAAPIDDEMRARVEREIDKLPAAQICTIDSFCNYIVKKYFYAANVDPQFAIIDDVQAESLKRVAIDEVFENFYDSGDQRFLRLFRQFINARKDEDLKSIVLDLNKFLSSEQDRSAYAEKCVKNYSKSGIDEIRKTLIGEVAAVYGELKDRLENYVQACRAEGLNKFADYVEEELARYNAYLADGSEESAAALVNLAFAKRKPPKVSKTEATVALNGEFEQIRGWVTYYTAAAKPFFTGEDLYAAHAEVERTVSDLFYVEKAFNDAFSAQKEEICGLDFSDVLHYAYEILCLDEIAKEVAADYKYVFVDEYQDTNAVQDAIFRRISKDNLFIVGDVKQSIYGFRGCDSDVFAQHVSSGGENLIRLDKNFRSAPAVIKAVNDVFSDLMTTKSAGLDYRSNPMEYGELYDSEGIVKTVVFGKEDGEKPTTSIPKGVYSVEKHLKTLTKNEFNAEAECIVDVVDKVLGTKYYVLVGGERVEKTVGFGDVAILTRTNKGLADKVIAKLVEAGVPVSSSSERSVGEYPEIKMLTGVLEAVECSGKLDYPLATALKSPVGGLKDEDLMRIRRKVEGGTFYSACKKYIEREDDQTSKKLVEFFEYINTLSLFAQFEGVDGVLKRIIADKDVETFLLRSRFGKIKLKRLERFVSALEAGGQNMSLEFFVKNEDAIFKKMTISLAAGENSVRVMTTHQSKGLEFPVVILCQLSRNFTLVDHKQKLTLSREYGVGVNYYDADTRTKYPTAVKSYISWRADDMIRREELRLLYVGMTRAKYALYIISSKQLPKTSGELDRFSANCALGFLPIVGECVNKTCSVSDPAAPQDKKVLLTGRNDGALLKEIERKLSFRYPYEGDVTLSVKRTVSDVVSSQNYEIEDVEPAAKPLYYKEETGVDMGNAYHKFLQHCDFSCEIVENEPSRLMAEGKLCREEFDRLDVQKLKNILKSDLFKRLQGYKLYREQPFIAYLDASDVGEVGSEKVVVQGVIDLLAVKGDEAIVVDYKYSVKGEEGLLRTYQKQLDLYGLAVEKVLGLEVKEKYLLNLLSGLTVKA